jgi:uncharacterized protein YbaR (Trm112 family)
MQKSFLDDAALAMLACPVCHAPLTKADDSTVLCAGCRRRYPVRDGLPVLLAAAAAL